MQIVKEELQFEESPKQRGKIVKCRKRKIQEVIKEH